MTVGLEIGPDLSSVYRIFELSGRICNIHTVIRYLNSQPYIQHIVSGQVCIKPKHAYQI